MLNNQEIEKLREITEVINNTEYIEAKLVREIINELLNEKVEELSKIVDKELAAHGTSDRFRAMCEAIKSKIYIIKNNQN